MEQAIVNLVLRIDKLQRESKEGMIVGWMILIVTSITALGLIMGVAFGWFKVLNWFLQTFYGISL